MDRRSFLCGSAGAVAAISDAAPAAAAVLKANGVRVSSDRDDPGYRLWCEARGDGKVVRVYLDGVEQRDAVTADEAEGSVYRAVRTPAGNIAIGYDEILRETVYGDVRVVIA